MLDIYNDFSGQKLIFIKPTEKSRSLQVNRKLHSLQQKVLTLNTEITPEESILQKSVKTIFIASLISLCHLEGAEEFVDDACNCGQVCLPFQGDLKNRLFQRYIQLLWSPFLRQKPLQRPIRFWNEMLLKGSVRGQISAIVSELFEEELANPVLSLETEVVARQEMDEEFRILTDCLLTNAHASDMNVKNEHHQLCLRVFKSENCISCLNKLKENIV